jgi:cell division protease FtsH
MPPPRPVPPNGSPRRRPGPGMPSVWVWLMLVGMAIIAWMSFEAFSSAGKIDYSQFWTLLRESKVSKVTIFGKDRLVGTVKDPADEEVKNLKLRSGEFVVNLPPGTLEGSNSELLRELLDKKVQVTSEGERANWFVQVLIFVLPTILLLALFFLLILPRLRDPLGGSFLSNYIKSPARRYERSKGRVTFDDVADMESAKSELQEVPATGRPGSQGRIAGWAARHRQDAAGPCRCR